MSAKHPQIFGIHMTGIGGFGNRAEAADPLHPKFISHVSIPIQEEVCPGSGWAVGKGGILTVAERKIRNWLTKEFTPGTDLFVGIGHSYGARDLIRRILTPLREEGIITHTNWVGLVIVDMEWIPGLFVADKHVSGPPCDWGYNLYQPHGLGGTRIDWDFPNEELAAGHARIDTALRTCDVIRACFGAAAMERLKRMEAAQ